jgi:hypothetical protein
MNGIVAGRIVHYVITQEEAKIINQRRNNLSMSDAPTGNTVQAGDHLPMIMTAVFPNEYGPDKPGINGQVFLDGNDSLWVTSRKYSESDAVGTWHWIEKA